jgi:hypothetical protein
MQSNIVKNGCSRQTQKTEIIRLEFDIPAAWTRIKKNISFNRLLPNPLQITKIMVLFVRYKQLMSHRHKILLCYLNITIL